MNHKFDLKICVCGHAFHNKACLNLVPNNGGKTHNAEYSGMMKCKCKKFDIAIDLSLSNIHVKEFGNY